MPGIATSSRELVLQLRHQRRDGLSRWRLVAEPDGVVSDMVELLRRGRASPVTPLELQPATLA